MYNDIVIKNGKIVNGTGKAPFFGDIAIKNSAISEIGEVNSRAKRQIDLKDWL